MSRSRRSAVLFVAAALLPASAAADLVRLTSGGEIRGVLVEPGGDADADLVTVETLTGGTVAVPKADVAFVTRRPREVEEYETLLKSTPDTAEGQWELAEWCRARRLGEQRADRLARVVELDSEHAAARAALGQAKHDGEWMTRDEAMAKRGLVPYKGRYVTPQELDLIERTAAERDREQAWFKEVRLWHGRLRHVDPAVRQRSVASLTAIDAPDAIPALSRFFRDDGDPAVRKLFVAVLAKIGGPRAVGPLVTQALRDVDQTVRHAAREAIPEDQYAAALPLFLAGLRDGRNEVVRRAGKGLERIGDERAVPDLIKSVVTTHRYQIRVPETAPTYSMSTAGTFGPGGTPLPPDVEAALLTGQLPNGVIVVDPSAAANVRWRTVTIAVNHENPEVLAALKALTGQAFGYDERTWRLWWAAKKNGLN